MVANDGGDRKGKCLCLAFVRRESGGFVLYNGNIFSVNRLFLFVFSAILTLSAQPAQTQRSQYDETLRGEQMLEQIRQQELEQEQKHANQRQRVQVRDEHVTPGGRRAVRRVQRGVASFYHRSLHGNLTANGERYNHNAMTVAHKSLPFGTVLRVMDPRNDRRIMVRVNDRGPFVRGRVLDLSGEAARRLGITGRGTARVDYEIVNPETLPSRQAPPPRKVKHL